jgi:hypothetical protein
METKILNKSIGFKDNVLTYGEYSLCYIENGGSLKIDHVEFFDAIILESRDSDFARLILKKVRSSFDINVYLKPVYLINHRDTKDSFVNELHDGIIVSFDQIPEKINEILHFQNLAKHLDHTPSNSFEIQLFKKALNFLYTRERRSLKPYVDSHSFLNYAYPMISVNFEAYEESKVLDILEWAFNQDLVWPDYFDRIYLCNNCQTGRLSIRETCPSCQSSNLKQEDLVHHFPCGYIGPISDFKNKVDGSLNCPKCSKTIRHIGVDYDKPSVINQCMNCNNVFQDYIVKAKCTHCSHDTEVQYLIPKEINVYKLTKKGRLAPVTGIVTSGFEIGEEISGTVAFNTFCTMMHYEQQRMKANTSLISNYSVLYMENIFEILKTMGIVKEKVLLSDIAQIIRDNISPADFISYQNPSLICVCINDEKLIDAQFMTQNVIKKLKELFHNNFDGFELTIKSRTQPLVLTEKFDDRLKEITKAMVEDI